MRKTLAMKLLEGKKIPYQVVQYPAKYKDATQIADHIGAPKEQLFKTLVVPAARAAGSKKKPMLVMIPAGKQLDLKKLARVTGEKKLKMATHAEAEALTGLEVGGISALALLNRGFAVLIENTAKQQQEIYVSAGQRGLNLKLSVDSLVKLTRARVASLCR
jgi:Cys-tRNA(Pro)/Cys-tRNA(Cys) deacylase